jgi:hypothetical protein
VTSFDQITKDAAVQEKLQEAYGTVADIDPFEGGMAEDHVAGSDLGPLFTTVIADRFNRLRAGDRFFYQNESWNADEHDQPRRHEPRGRGLRPRTGVAPPSARPSCRRRGDCLGAIDGRRDDLLRRRPGQTDHEAAAPARLALCGVSASPDPPWTWNLNSRAS